MLTDVISAAAAAADVTGYESRRSLIELHTQRELSVSKPLLRVQRSLHSVSVGVHCNVVYCRAVYVVQ